MMFQPEDPDGDAFFQGCFKWVIFFLAGLILYNIGAFVWSVMR